MSWDASSWKGGIKGLARESVLHHCMVILREERYYITKTCKMTRLESEHYDDGGEMMHHCGLQNNLKRVSE